MASWRQLTQTDGTKILVNVDNVRTAIGNPTGETQLTTIKFIGLKYELHVKESPAEIVALSPP
jgi:hypothetical protein